VTVRTVVARPGPLLAEEGVRVITQKYGLLELGFVTAFDLQWNDRGSGAPLNGSFWLPKPPSGWHALGCVGRGGYTDINGKEGALVVRQADSGTGLLAPPVDYELIWQDRGSGADTNGAVWRPKPPVGYAALGDVFGKGWNKPPLTAVVCVKIEHGGRRYVRQAEAVDRIWDDTKSGADKDVSVWSILPPAYPNDTDKRLLLTAGTFTAVASHDRPSTTPVVNVLDLPAAGEEHDGPRPPAMTSHDRPQDTVKILDRTDVVPYTMISDLLRDEAWRVANTPFYTLQRHRWYTVVHYYDNRNGTRPDGGDQTVETGVSEEESKAFTAKTGVTVTTEAGVSVGLVSAKTSISVSLELGYEQRYAITQFRSESKKHTLTVPPGAAGCLWSLAHELVPIRRDGSLISAGSVLSFKTDSIVKGEYPGNAGVSHTATAIPSGEQAAAPDDTLSIPVPAPVVDPAPVLEPQ
jgi:hypothetical protein